MKPHHACQNSRFKPRGNFLEVHKECGPKRQNCTCLSIWVSTGFYFQSGFLFLFSLKRRSVSPHKKTHCWICWRPASSTKIPTGLSSLDWPTHSCHVLLHLQEYSDCIINCKVFSLQTITCIQKVHCYKTHTSINILTNKHLCNKYTPRSRNETWPAVLSLSTDKPFLCLSC